VVDVKTQPSGFAIVESQLLERAEAENPELIYLSLPNNPTGAIFKPEQLLDGIRATTAIVLDLTLPSGTLDAKALVNSLCERYYGRKGLFLIGSTSKSHETAEYRIGWVICASPDDAAELRKENRNVVSTIAIAEGIKQLQKRPTAIEKIEQSFALLREAEGAGTFEIVRPHQHVESGYVLIRSRMEVSKIREALAAQGIRVMWGSEFGLTDEYIRLETLESSNIKVFVETIRRSANRQPLGV
jgi:aspartate/methionine/tyrosine aminotransferase